MRVIRRQSAALVLTLLVITTLLTGLVGSALATTEAVRAPSDDDAEVGFRTETIDRNNDSLVAERGIAVTIYDYAGAARVQVTYDIPDGPVLYQSRQYDVSNVKQPGRISPEQADPDRGPDELLVTDIDSEGEYAPYTGEYINVTFYDNESQVIDKVIYRVGVGEVETATPTATKTEIPTSKAQQTTTPVQSPSATTPTGDATPAAGSQGETTILTRVPDTAIGGGVAAVLLIGLAYGVMSQQRPDHDEAIEAEDGMEREPDVTGVESERSASENVAVTGAFDSGATTETSPVPDSDAVTSPPRRELSYDDLSIDAQLGGGGQAVISKARLSEGPPETVAIREPDTAGTLTREAAESFQRKADMWATIDAREREKQRWDGYEHVVGIVDTGDQQPWLAMEYMDGGDLGELLAAHPDGLPVSQALWLGEGICKGLEVAHALGHVHLDVKPENVLLKETDGWKWPKLADWGLARSLADETGSVEQLTVAYAAPEQFESDVFGDPDQLTDIYQAGNVVYALLTGSPPVSGNQLEIMQSVLDEGAITPPSAHRPELSAEVDAALARALAQTKTDRYDSVAEFGAALRAIRTGERLPRAVAERLD